jgi:hypothetical protein
VKLGYKAHYLSSLQNDSVLYLPSLLAPIHCVYTPCVMASYRLPIPMSYNWSVRVHIPESGSACSTSWLRCTGSTARAISGRADSEFGVGVLFGVPVS